MPAARELFPLGEQAEATNLDGQPALLCRFAPGDRPRAGHQPNLWLAYGHAHWGLTLGPVTGRLMAEMMTGATPFCDPAPFAAERFTR